jgi:hypothetical protein
MKFSILTAIALVSLSLPAVALTLPTPPTDSPAPQHAAGGASRFKSVVRTYKIYYITEFGGEPILYQRFTGTAADLNLTVNLLGRQNPTWGWHIRVES